MTTNYTPTSAPRPFILAGLHQAIADAEDMFTRLDATIAIVRGALAAQSPTVVRGADTACGDVHVMTPEEQWEEEGGPIAALSISMLDTCLGSLPELQAACLLVELERDEIWVEPVPCGSCGQTHLVRKAGR